MTYTTTSRLVSHGPGKYDLSVATFTKGYTVQFTVWSTIGYVSLEARISGVTEANTDKTAWVISGKINYPGIAQSEQFEASYQTGSMQPRGFLWLKFKSDEALDASELAKLLGLIRPGKTVRTKLNPATTYVTPGEARIDGTVGTIERQSMGTCWMVRNADGTVGAYNESELTLV